MPGLFNSSLQVGITDSTTITHGQATTTSSQVSFTAGFRPEVPALTEYLVTVTGTQATYEVPYTWNGVATYDNGMTADVEGTGLLTGGSEGNFKRRSAA